MKILVWTAMFAVLLSANSCDRGYSISDSSSGGDTTATTTKYIGPTQGASWSIVWDKDNAKFTLEKRSKPSASPSYTVYGTFKELDSGFIELDFPSSRPSSITSSSTAALKLGDHAFVIYPFESGQTQLLYLIVADSCPSTDLATAWLSVDDASDVSSDAVGSYGYLSYSKDDKAINITDSYALDDGNTTQIASTIDSGSCTSNVYSAATGDHYFSSAHTLIIENDKTTYQRKIGFSKTSINSLTDLSGDGVGFISNTADPADTFEISATCNNGSCNIFSESDINNLHKNDNTYNLTIDDNGRNFPAVGFAVGKLELLGNSTLTNIACIYNTSLVSGKVLLCAASSPDNLTRLLNITLYFPS